MNDYDVILFDMDGTLTDSSPGIIHSVVYALDKYNIRVENQDELRKFLGPPLHISFRDFYGFDEDKAMEAVGFYREYFRTKGIFENSLYDGIGHLIRALKERKKQLIVATSKPQDFTDTIMEYFDLTRYFDFVAGSNMDGSRSAKADVIEYALKSCNVTDKSKAVMVGDRKHDIIGAKAAGIDSIGVEYGYGDYDELLSAEATYIAGSVGELYELLL